ncbi:LOW QUALITY PROTEIN: hypothetical protein MAR_008082 [Mya arenaria]|uniref:Uncharacterized protein n=1 Tax=Mya arenaria TaxID=6604 RepID=A0ABY7DWV7_MYAAR|nr:LOW QUALITY PROTEIN: hypothetical protein MAR_008082 [Mya arenaria]
MTMHNADIHMYERKNNCQAMDLSTTYPQVYKNFMEGIHGVQHSDIYWAGLSTDVIIEQMLICSVKTVGGLTSSEGTVDLVPASMFRNQLQNAGINRNVSRLCCEQHKESGESRKSRDNEDI